MQHYAHGDTAAMSSEVGLSLPSVLFGTDSHNMLMGVPQWMASVSGF